MVFSWWVVQAQETNTDQSSIFKASLPGTSATLSLAKVSQMAKPKVSRPGLVVEMIYTPPTLMEAHQSHMEEGPRCMILLKEKRKKIEKINSFYQKKSYWNREN